jgi:hypothetical protein
MLVLLLLLLLVLVLQVWFKSVKTASKGKKGVVDVHIREHCIATDLSKGQERGKPVAVVNEVGF